MFFCNLVNLSVFVLTVIYLIYKQTQNRSVPFLAAVAETVIQVSAFLRDIGNDAHLHSL